MLAMAEDGRIISSKFVTDLNLSSETIINISVMADNSIIKTAETFHAIGNFGADKDDIINSLIVERDNLSKAVYFNGQVIALHTDGSLKIVDAGGISPFSAANGIVSSDILVIAGNLLVLHTDGTLQEIKEDNSIVDVAAGVSEISYAQDAITCLVNGSKRAIFSSNGTWFTYDYNVNTL
jgi:hypothetical protein